MDVKKFGESLKERGFGFSYFESKDQAKQYLVKEIQNKKIAMGGSVTIDEMGLYEELKKNNDITWHWLEPGKYNLSPDVYITSVNALSENGELVNIDGAGNRVAGTLFGAKEVFFVCGINKLEPNLEKAIWRAKNIAAPKNAKRLKRKTPCAVKADKCYECNSPECICRALSVIWKPMLRTERYEVVLIGEELGY